MRSESEDCNNRPNAIDNDKGNLFISPGAS